MRAVLLFVLRAHYKHPLPEHVYDAYMQYWRDVRLASEDASAADNTEDNAGRSPNTKHE